MDHKKNKAVEACGSPGSQNKHEYNTKLKHFSEYLGRIFVEDGRPDRDSKAKVSDSHHSLLPFVAPT